MGKQKTFQKILAMLMTAFLMVVGFDSAALAMVEKSFGTSKSTTQVIEFEDTNRYSSDWGNGVRTDMEGYSGNGYVYLASGWAEVNFDIATAGNYKVTIVSNSDQYKENWLYLDKDGAGTLYTQGNRWQSDTYEFYLSAGNHKFGVSSNWGYVGLDKVIIEPVGGSGVIDPVDPPVDPDPVDPTPVDPEKTTKVEFEDINSFSSDWGNGIAKDFAEYSGDGYVYLAQGWAEVKFSIEEAGNYKLTIAHNSDQYKENLVYLDNDSAGTLTTQGNRWEESEYTVSLSAGEHKFGVSSSWGYVALDYVKIEKVGDIVNPPVDPDPEPPVDPTPQGGMYVRGTTLYDGNGNPFVMRGVNLPHAWYTDKTTTSINAVASLGANSIRVVLADGTQWDKTSKSEVEAIINQAKAKGLVTVLEVHDHTGFDDPSRLDIAVNYWLEMKDLLNDNKDYVIVNIANEWLGTWNKAQVWTDTYVNAIKKLRNAGLENVIMVDAPGYGQETQPMIDNCQTVLNADKTGNTMFSIHMYSVAGENESVVKSNIDRMLAKGVCTVIGEFGDFQNGGDVDEATIISYSEDKKIGTLAWSWKGNGGNDATLDMSRDWAGTDLTDWGKYAFYAEKGIYNTSVMAYTLKKPDGTGGTPVDPPTPPTGDGNEDIIIPPDADAEINIDAGYLSSLTTEWYISGDGDDTVSDLTTLSILKNGGYRVSFDLTAEPYPYLVNMVGGLDLSTNKVVNVIVRNNNAYDFQLQPIFKIGDLWEWTEFDKYQTVPAKTTVQLSYDLSKYDMSEVNALLFRIQGAGGKFAGTADFLSVQCDLADDAYRNEIAELNRPKTASYFTWAYPEASFVDQTTSTSCSEDGILTVNYKGVTSDNAAGIQTETKPGLGKGLDCSYYKTLTCTITNNGTTNASVSLLLRSTSNWTWQENIGVANGAPCEVIKPGESIEVTYSLKDSVWKSKASDWEYTGLFQDPDDVRSIGFKIWSDSASGATGQIQISDFQFNF